MKKSPGKKAVGDVGRLNAIDIGANHRNLKRDKGIREWVEIAPRAAPRIRCVKFGLLVRAVTSGYLHLTIVRRSGVLQCQQSIRCRSSDSRQNRIHEKKVIRVSLIVFDTKGDVLP